MKNLDALTREMNEIGALALNAPAEAMTRLEDTKFHHPDLMWLRACVMFEACRNLAAVMRKADEPKFTEFDVHHVFWDNLQELLPGARRIKGPVFDGRNKPDGWVSINGEAAPVEVKRDVFTGRARNQLMRYMRAYDARRGIAVCPKFRCETDPVITRVVCAPSLLN